MYEGFDITFTNELPANQNILKLIYFRYSILTATKIDMQFLIDQLGIVTHKRRSDVQI